MGEVMAALPIGFRWRMYRNKRLSSPASALRHAAVGTR